MSTSEIEKLKKQRDELVGALKYCQWKLENIYENQHELFEEFHTKESYRSTEEGIQFARAIDKSKEVLAKVQEE